VSRSPAGVEGDAPLRRRDVLLPAAIVAAGTLLLDTRTLLPDVSVWDTAEFQAIGPVLGIAHPTGYPSYTLLAWLASIVLQPFGEAAVRANLLSAILAAVGTGATAAAVAAITRRPVLGLVSGTALALAPVAWRIGLRADAHALHFALVGILLALLVGWMLAERRGDPPRAGGWLFAAAIVFGISLGNHALTLLVAPGIAVFILLVSPRLVLDRPRLVLACAAGLVITTVVLYAYIPIRSAMDPPLDYADPETWDRFRYLVFAEQFRGTFRTFPPLDEAIATVSDELFANLALLGVVAIIGAAVTAARRLALFVLTASWFVIPFAFALGYQNADIRRYYLVPILVAAVWAGLGAEALWAAARAAWDRLALPGDPPGSDPRAARVVSSLAVPALAGALLLAPALGALPDRFAEVDASGETWPRRWLDSAMANIPHDAVVVSWWSFSTTLWYGQYVEGTRPDMLILDDRTMLDRDLGTVRDVIEQYRGRRPVVLIRLPREIADLREDYALDRLAGMPSWAPIWRLDV
jgi:hypothetical protein